MRIVGRNSHPTGSAGMRLQETASSVGGVVAVSAARGMAGHALVHVCPRNSMALGDVGDTGELRASGHPD